MGDVLLICQIEFLGILTEDNLEIFIDFKVVNKIILRGKVKHVFFRGFIFSCDDVITY